MAILLASCFLLDIVLVSLQNDSKKLGIHWKSWDLLKDRKDNGGLGFRDLMAFNRALLAKQAWRLIHCPLSLWSQLCKGLYFHSQNFLRATKGAYPSWGWQSILIGRDSLSPKLRWSVGDGSQIHIREDCWLPRGIIGGPMDREEPRMVAELILPEQNKWNEVLLQQLFDEETTKEILSISVRPNYTDDQLIWTENSNG